MIRLINRLEEPTSGSIIVRYTLKENGVERKTVEKNILNFEQEELREYRKKTGMIFQHFNLLNSRNVENIVVLPNGLSLINSNSISRLPRKRRPRLLFPQAKQKARSTSDHSLTEADASSPGFQSLPAATGTLQKYPAAAISSSAY